MTALSLKFEPVLQISSEEFYQICQENPDLKLERSAEGVLIIMPPTGGETGKRNINISGQLWLWNEQYQLGEAFDSSTGFSLPNGADRSPDASWIEKSRWESLNPSQRESFIPLCPDFVIELLSSTDSLKKTQEKMQEYLDNGCRLGWLINRKKQEVEIYRSGKEVEILSSPQTLSGEDVLLGFILNLAKIWS
jgi:Uma2 family endonuclease